MRALAISLGAVEYGEIELLEQPVPPRSGAAKQNHGDDHSSVRQEASGGSEILATTVRTKKEPAVPIFTSVT